LNSAFVSKDAIKVHAILKQTKRPRVFNSVTVSKDDFKAHAIVKQTKRTPH